MERDKFLRPPWNYPSIYWKQHSDINQLGQIMFSASALVPCCWLRWVSHWPTFSQFLSSFQRHRLCRPYNTDSPSDSREQMWILLNPENFLHFAHILDSSWYSLPFYDLRCDIGFPLMLAGRVDRCIVPTAILMSAQDKQKRAQGKRLAQRSKKQRAL